MYSARNRNERRSPASGRTPGAGDRLLCTGGNSAASKKSPQNAILANRPKRDPRPTADRVPAKSWRPPRATREPTASSPAANRACLAQLRGPSVAVRAKCVQSGTCGAEPSSESGCRTRARTELPLSSRGGLRPSSCSISPLRPGIPSSVTAHDDPRCVQNACNLVSQSRFRCHQRPSWPLPQTG